ncbi:helix-turn-helix domain-containing protein [uncultured Cocleimonas sp.]|uniref:helix-turn-helix domain-containing protein n=1 Tax=uncultured Cocleimonas sp. TaxID=1051587 RepID=UPI0026129F10|nr:helix-turn-helix domain-containing protein [uncultured Cocleimonas sp.]
MEMKQLKRLRTPRTLIENRISFAGPSSEVSIYDTYESAKRVRLDAGELLVCGMMTGRKIMHSPNESKGQEFLPHETFIMAPGEVVTIDFPDARRDKPTTCLTVEISKDKVSRVSQRLSDSIPMLESANDWQFGCPVLHTHHSSETQRLLSRLTKLFTENHPDRDTLIDLNISELIIRMLRHKTRDFLLTYCSKDPEANSLIAALDWINSTLSKPLDIDHLCKHAGMSRSRLYVEFKEKLGCSPVELQQQLRLKHAAERIRNGESITAISYDLGFNNPSHFCYRFKNFFGCTATEYKQRGIVEEAVDENVF